MNRISDYNFTRIKILMFSTFEIKKNVFISIVLFFYNVNFAIIKQRCKNICNAHESLQFEVY